MISESAKSAMKTDSISISGNLRVVIADDHSLILRGLNLLLSRSTFIEIVGEAKSGKEAFDLVNDLKPDVLITDISMPEWTGLDLTKSIIGSNLQTKVLILSNFFDEKHVVEAYKHGAKGYLPKSIDDEHLIEAIRKIAGNEVYYSQSVLDLIGASIIKSKIAEEIEEDLTSREKEVLQHLAEGETNKKIGKRLFISTRTVDAHRRNIMKKLHVNNVAQLVRVCIEKNLV